MQTKTCTKITTSRLSSCTFPYNIVMNSGVCLEELQVPRESQSRQMCFTWFWMQYNHTGSTDKCSVVFYKVQVQFCTVSLKNKLLSSVYHSPLSFIFLLLFFFTFTQWSNACSLQEVSRGEGWALVWLRRIRDRAAARRTLVITDLHMRRKR